MRVAIIGGSGFGEAFADGRSEQIETEYGAASVVHSDLGDGRELIFLARHGAGHSLPPHRINHHANIAALRLLDVSAVFATAAVGSLQIARQPGDFVILSDFLDVSKGGVTTFFDQPGQVRHTDFGEPFHTGLRSLLAATSGPIPDADIHPQGTYVYVSGPRYETPAEIRLFASWGADVVGMTTVPEAILCRESKMPYAAVAVVTNYGCGLVSGQTLDHREVEAQMQRSRQALRDWLLRAARAVI